jgi:hypothetical protein
MFCAWQVFGVQIEPPSELPPVVPHLLNPPPPHVWGAVHVPHCSNAPQPSLAGPQS